MSATPNRVAWESSSAPAPVQEGNRVLESIGRQEGLRALLAFSDLHEQIRNRRLAASGLSDWDLFQTERFVLDEVLQLICDRVQTITNADGILVGLTQGSDVVCRATSGSLSIPRGTLLNPESRFLRECLQSGRILRCDDSATDTRVEYDSARQLDARCTVLVPLRGHGERLGVLQAFSKAPWAFADHDVRSLDLFAELVLAALKPEDQDRRIHWLSGVAGEILQSKAAAGQVAPNVATAAVQEASAAGISSLPQPESGLTDLTTMTSLADPVVIPVVDTELADLKFADIDHIAPPLVEAASPDYGSSSLSEKEQFSNAAATRLYGALVANSAENIAGGTDQSETISKGIASGPGVRVLIGIAAAGALFCVGVWWHVELHGKSLFRKQGWPASAQTKLAAEPKSVTTPSTPAPDVLSPASDHLMDASQPNSQDAPLVPVPAGKLAALPKITGVRHWSSSIGSTVVIDMQDQVPYEVHRLMSPERIYFDLHDTALTADLDGKTMDVGDASLTKVRVAQPVAGVTRIVLDTRDGSNFSVSMESNPYRLVVELRDSAKLASTTRILQPVAKAAPTASLSATADLPPRPVPLKTGKFRIVLDAGHGGWDLGTVGREGLLEKDLVLDVTKRLGKLLQSRLGSEVMFTRTGDDYLPLDQRADFANQAQADLFVSVHANYSNSANARGVETYYTNLFAAPGSKELEKNPDTAAAKPSTVSLSSAGLREKIAESRHLAASVQRSLYATLAAKSPDIRDRGTKEASFAVLTGTTMPAILTEISFVSSPADEHNLQSEIYRQQIAEALYKGIARYEESSPKPKVAQLRPVTTGR